MLQVTWSVFSLFWQQKRLFRFVFQPFAKYSNLVRKELARVIEFETFEDGRIIMREGHHGCSMYFIVAGSVTVQVGSSANCPCCVLSITCC